MLLSYSKSKTVLASSRECLAGVVVVHVVAGEVERARRSLRGELLHWFAIETTVLAEKRLDGRLTRHNYAILPVDLPAVLHHFAGCRLQQLCE